MKKMLIAALGLVSVSSYAELSSNLTLASDYVWRGQSRTDGPAILGGFEYNADSGYYVGIWGSNVDFSDGNGQELNYYAGFDFNINDSVTGDLGFLYYDYPNASTDLDYGEAILELNISDFTLQYAYDTDDELYYIEASYSKSGVTLAVGNSESCGTNVTASYVFDCGEYECGITAYTFDAEKPTFKDEDGLFFSISA